MTTHEREITEPVDLCLPGATTLDPSALGWSRVPLHRANLTGEWGRNKRWDYWAVLAGDLILAVVYSNIDHFGLVDVFWADIAAGARGGAATIAEPEAVVLPERCGTAPLEFARNGIEVALVDDDGGTRLTARWTDADGSPGEFDVYVELPPGHESLNVVIPWDETTFNFTSKHQARPARGVAHVGGQTRLIEGDAWGVLDVGRGRWPHELRWNWGGGAGCNADGRVIGLQFGAKWTEGSGFTENGFILDGRLTKLGQEFHWQYDWDEPLAPWRITDPGGQLDVVLTPRFDKHSQADAGDFASETHQVFGTFAGFVVDDDGVRVEFDGIQGFAEEARQRW